MTDDEPTETLEMFLDSVRPGQVRTATVTGFAGRDVIVDLDGTTRVHQAAGVLLGYELTWSDVEDPAEMSVSVRRLRPK